MKREQVIKAVDQAVFYSSKQITLNKESKDFNQNVEKIVRFVSANVILTVFDRNIYIGNSQVVRMLQNKFGGKIRHSVDRFWEGNVGISQLTQFLNQKTGVQTLRFNIAEEDLSPTITAIQKMFKRDLVLQGDSESQNAYIGSRKHVYRLKRKYPSADAKIRKYGNYWIWQTEKLPMKDDEITSFIDAGKYLGKYL